MLGIYSEKAMAPHSSTLAWKIAWTEEGCDKWSRGCVGCGGRCWPWLVIG